MNDQLIKESMNSLKKLLLEHKDMFAWTYKNLKGIPKELAQHQIELNTSIPLVHQARYKMNPNYATIVRNTICF